MVMTWPRVLDVVGLAALFVASSLAFPTLPERIPTHFGFDGRPDAWTPTTLASWFALPAVALAMAAVLHALPALLSRHPGWVHLLDGRDVGAVPPRHRPLVQARIRDLMDWVALAVTLCLSLLQGAVHLAARGHDTRGLLLVLLLLGPIVLALTVAYTQRIDADLRRAGAGPGA